MNTTTTRRLTAAALGATLLLAACGAATTPTTSAPTPSPATVVTPGAAAGPGGQVLPATSNPIANSSSTQGFTIDSVLVENNVNASGAAVEDHLEIAVTNTSSTVLDNFEVYTTYTDATAGISESYYTALPASFTIPPGGTRVMNFDNSGATDHFAVNQFGLYATSVNALDVEVMVSATGAAPQTATVQKDAGGAEVPD